jgi:hypothetical protein
LLSDPFIAIPSPNNETNKTTSHFFIKKPSFLHS